MRAAIVSTNTQLKTAAPITSSTGARRRWAGGSSAVCVLLELVGRDLARVDVLPTRPPAVRHQGNRAKFSSARLSQRREAPSRLPDRIQGGSARKGSGKRVSFGKRYGSGFPAPLSSGTPLYIVHLGYGALADLFTKDPRLNRRR